MHRFDLRVPPDAPPVHDARRARDADEIARVLATAVRVDDYARVPPGAAIRYFVTPDAPSDLASKAPQDRYRHYARVLANPVQVAREHIPGVEPAMTLSSGAGADRSTWTMRYRLIESLYIAPDPGAVFLLATAREETQQQIDKLQGEINELRSEIDGLRDMLRGVPQPAQPAAHNAPRRSTHKHRHKK